MSTALERTGFSVIDGIPLIFNGTVGTTPIAIDLPVVQGTQALKIKVLNLSTTADIAWQFSPPDATGAFVAPVINGVTMNATRGVAGAGSLITTQTPSEFFGLTNNSARKLYIVASAAATPYQLVVAIGN